MIPAEDLGALLFSLHSHVELFTNPDEIVYSEADVIRLLKKLGFPEPVFGTTVNFEEYKLPEENTK